MLFLLSMVVWVLHYPIVVLTFYQLELSVGGKAYDYTYQTLMHTSTTTSTTLR